VDKLWVNSTAKVEKMRSQRIESYFEDFAAAQVGADQQFAADADARMKIDSGN
jgi:hypothetical protein